MTATVTTPAPLKSARPTGIQRSLFKTWGYRAIRAFSRLTGVLLFRLRVEGTEHYPAAGAALVCSNHQSFFDPVLVGLTCNRRMNYLARESLFRVPGLKQMIQFLDAIPIDRDGSGIAGLKETLKRLKAAEMVLIFPEGTRTSDGEMLPLKPGFCSVARRSKAPLVPVGVDGAYHAWPRTARFPRLASMAVVVGPPIGPDEMAVMTDEQLVAELEARIGACHRRARFLREN